MQNEFTVFTIQLLFACTSIQILFASLPDLHNSFSESTGRANKQLLAQSTSYSEIPLHFGNVPLSDIFNICLISGACPDVCERKDHSGDLGGYGLSHGEPSHSQRSQTREHPGGQEFPHQSMNFISVFTMQHTFKKR